MYKRFALATVVALSASVAHAQSSEETQFYVGAQYGAQDVDFLPSRDLETLGLHAGYRFSPHFSIEARLNNGISGYSVPFQVDGSPNAEYKEDIDMQAALFAKASYPVTESFGVYALLGLAKSDYEITTTLSHTDIQGNTSVTYPSMIDHSETGVSYGLGVEYQVADSIALFAEYQVLPDIDLGGGGERWTSTNIGFSYSF